MILQNRRRRVYYPKPAYYGVRNAITNYFGLAFSVRNSAGEELVRFVENGNVLLMKKDAQVHTSGEGLAAALNSAGMKFIVKDSSGVGRAVVTPDGDLYLAGDVYSQADPLDEPCASGPSFRIVRGRDGKVMSLIDQEGNLILRDENPDPSESANENNPHTGYVLVYGLPYNLTTDNPPNQHDYLSTDGYLEY